VRCNWFNQNFNESFFLGPVLDGAISIPAGDAVEPFVDAGDIADVAVAALTEPGHDGQVYELSGPRLLGFHEVAREISAATGRNVVYSPVTADRDPAVQQAIRLIHGSPDKPWTVESLAGSVGVSRASLARRFHERVGKPPMTYLNQWRLAKAADLMSDPALTLTTISRQVGYASPFSFSSAFKRRYGVSPQEYRRRQPAASIPVT
jgi:AraC-like DNA-binding protein